MGQIMEASRGRRASCEPRHHVWLTEHIALTRGQRLCCCGMANHFNPHPGGRWVCLQNTQAGRHSLLAGRQGGTGRALTTIRSAVLACTLSARLLEALRAAPRLMRELPPVPRVPFCSHILLIAPCLVYKAFPSLLENVGLPMLASTRKSWPANAPPIHHILNVTLEGPGRSASNGFSALSGLCCLGPDGPFPEMVSLPLFPENRLRKVF